MFSSVSIDVVSLANSGWFLGPEQKRDSRGQLGHYCQASLNTRSSSTSFHKPFFDTYREGFSHPDEACYYSGNKKNAVLFTVKKHLTCGRETLGQKIPADGDV